MFEVTSRRWNFDGRTFSVRAKGDPANRALPPPRPFTRPPAKPAGRWSWPALPALIAVIGKAAVQTGRSSVIPSLAGACHRSRRLPWPEWSCAYSTLSSSTLASTHNCLGTDGALAAPNPRQPAATQGSTGSTVSAQEALERRVAELEALLAQANVIPTPGDNPTIPRPDKIVKIQVQMGLGTDRAKYKQIQRGIRKIADQALFDCTLDWRRQPKDKVSQAFAVARKWFPYLCRFENDWVINHFLHQFLKNRRAYEKKLAEEEELGSDDEMDT